VPPHEVIPQIEDGSTGGSDAGDDEFEFKNM
jgi:hypothetical protein